jgi:hypothetical protein
LREFYFILAEEAASTTTTATLAYYGIVEVVDAVVVKQFEPARYAYFSN